MYHKILPLILWLSCLSYNVQAVTNILPGPPVTGCSSTDVILGCNYTTDASPPFIEFVTWKKGRDTVHQRVTGNDQPGPGYENRTSTISGEGQASLILRNVTRLDSGVYECVVNISPTGGLSPEGRVDLDVWSFTRGSSNANCQDCSCTLTCDSVDVYPKANYTWSESKKGEVDKAQYTSTCNLEGNQSSTCTTQAKVLKPPGGVAENYTCKSDHPCAKQADTFKVEGSNGSQCNGSSVTPTAALKTSASPASLVKKWYFGLVIGFGAVLVVLAIVNVVIVVLIVKPRIKTMHMSDKWCGLSVLTVIISCLCVAVGLADIIVPILNCKESGQCCGSIPPWAVILIIFSVISIVAGAASMVITALMISSDKKKGNSQDDSKKDKKETNGIDNKGSNIDAEGKGNANVDQKNQSNTVCETNGTTINGSPEAGNGCLPNKVEPQPKSGKF